MLAYTHLSRGHLPSRYKDGEPVDFGERTEDTDASGLMTAELIVRSESDLMLVLSGDYQCLAVSGAGSTWSRPAALLVYTGTFCILSGGELYTQIFVQLHSN